MSAIPDTLQPRGLDDYLEVMTRAVFQAGLSWQAIARRWGAFREAFERFDAQRVAGYTEGDIDRILRLEGMLKSPKKIRATIENAKTLVSIDGSYGGFAKYLRSHDGYDALAKDLRKRFKFMGDMNVWYLLFRVRAPVPPFEQWVTTIAGDHPRMREMVEKARAAGLSSETR